MYLSAIESQKANSEKSGKSLKLNAKSRQTKLAMKKFID